MALTDRVAALATRIGQELKALRLVKADDAAVVHNTGAETISGVKTFGSPPLVPVGTLLSNPVRRDDARLSDARAPTVHAASHSSGGADPISPAAIGAAAAGHTHSDLVPGTRTVTAGTGLTGGGTLAADRTLSVVYGSTAGTAAQGNDVRLSDARPPTAHSHTPSEVGAAPASHTHPTTDVVKVISSQVTVGNGGTATPTQTADIARFNSTGATATLAVPSGTPADGSVVNSEVYATGSATTLTLASGYVLTGGQATTVVIPTGRVAFIASRYRSVAPIGWRVLAVSVDN